MPSHYSLTYGFVSTKCLKSNHEVRIQQTSIGATFFGCFQWNEVYASTQRAMLVSETSHDGSKTPKDSVRHPSVIFERCIQRATRLYWFEDIPNTPQDALKTSADASDAPPRRFKTAPRRSATRLRRR